MKCILHIGTEKTGTTSLQEFFHLNREKLASLGYLYTRSAGLSNNESLPVAAFNADRRDGFTKRHGIFNDAELLAFQAKTIAGLKQEINNARNIHTVIFSSEQIQSRLKTDEELIRLKAILAELGLHEISVLVYLRSPVEIANSLYATAIKTGSVAEQPPAPDNEHWNNICNHRNTLVRFANIFGSSSLLPRLYGKQELLNGSIIDDFCAATGLPLAKATFLIPGPQNENLTVSGLEIMRRLNQHIPVFDENQRLNPLRKDLLPFVTQHLNKGDKYGISAELRQQYQRAFNDSNEWVRAHYFPERPSLFGSVNIPPPSSQQFGADDLDQIACLIATLWKDKANAEQQLNKGASGPLARILKRLGSKLKHR